MNCTECCTALEGEEIENPFQGEGGPVCDDCYRSSYMDYCPLCSDYYDKPAGPEETFFFLIPHTAIALGMKPGLYRVLAWPYYYGDCISGFDNFEPGATALARECDIVSIKREIGGNQPGYSGECCRECFEKFTNPGRGF